MLHRDDTAAAGQAVEPATLVAEPDEEPEQYQDTRCPQPPDPHRHGPWRQEKGKPERPEDRRPGEGGEIESERPCPAHRRISALAAFSAQLIVAGCHRSNNGRAIAPRYLTYSLTSSAAVPRHAHQRSCLTWSGKTG